MPKKTALIKCLLFGFVIQAGGIISTADAVIRRVPEDYNNIQAAINAASNGDTVDVNDGTYWGTGNYNIDTLGKAIEVRSVNGPDNCIIDCNFLGRGFICRTGETSSTVIRGFTIINGFAEDSSWPLDFNEPNMFDNPNSNGYGGAIYCKDASPTITGCVIRWNQADGFGGGIYSRGGSPTIQFCEISWNLAAGSGGGIAFEDSNAGIAQVLYSTISFNDCWLDNDEIDQHGGGIYCKGGNVGIAGCDIIENNANWSGGGIAAVDSNVLIIGIPDVIELRITDNVCWASGGGIYSEGNPNDPNIPNIRIKNCLIANNWGAWSGGISSNYDSFTDINYCTIANNTAAWKYLTDDIGGLETYFGDAIVTNSILWGNTGFQIAGIQDANNVTYSDVQIKDSNGVTDFTKVWQDVGNINVDPLFVSPINRDYRLNSGIPMGASMSMAMATAGFGIAAEDDPNTSPCINAGDPFADSSLEPAPNGGRVNMGAYGGTVLASESDIIRPVPSDANADLAVNMIDFAILADNWLLTGTDIKDRNADVDNNGIVDGRDLFYLNTFWLW